jgi:DNA-binding CsgD family transcriptional regulator
MARPSLSDHRNVDAQGTVAQGSRVRAYQTPHTSMRLALALITELSACLHMITRDIARPKDLEMASLRWGERLAALMQAIEQVVRREGAERPRQKYATSLPSIPNASSLQQAFDGELTKLAGHPGRHPRLTPREREVMELARRGYPPSKIARRLHLSVQTVYTHLRNVRRKQLR